RYARRPNYAWSPDRDLVGAVLAARPPATRRLWPPAAPAAAPGVWTTGVGVSCCGIARSLPSGCQARAGFFSGCLRGLLHSRTTAGCFVTAHATALAGY